ncbi:MAG: AbiA family abortive infection protein [Clostridiales bacterium]|nr:AbiA family abortive infection protein [Clostridiales bacterium]
MKTNTKKSYLQWFPFTKLSHTEKEVISSEDFYNNYIKTFSFILFPNNLYQSNNFIQKSDGSFRNASLVSPILYLALQAMGKEIFDIYNHTRSSNVSVYYAGSYEFLRPNYKQEYDSFFKKINSNIDSFQYFIKTDITNFYSSININKLIARIDEICNNSKMKISQSELLIFKELLLFCGNGKFPLIENSVASSFLSTVVYLDDIDSKLYLILKDKFPEITDFKIIRYVDDMYILLSSETSIKFLHEIYNEIRNIYSSLLKEYDLSLNAKKCCLKGATEINAELKKSLYDEFFNGEKHNIEDLFPNSLLEFIRDLSNELSYDSIDVDSYNELINKHFTSTDIEFTPNEILNYFVYENPEKLSEPHIVKELINIVEKSISFISLDPKRLTLMIIKTKNDRAIKAFLNQLFKRSRAGKWNSYDTTIAITYLIQNKFRHLDLLKIIKSQSPLLFDFYELYCKGSFLNEFNDTNLNKLRNVISNDLKAHYLYFMFVGEYKKRNIMSAFAFFKNYFDRVTADIDFVASKDLKLKRPNYKRFYKEQSFKDCYQGFPNSDSIIEKAHELRNANPLSHSSSELLDNNNSSNELEKSIENLSNLISWRISKVS